MDSILITIKKMLGIDAEDDSFDMDIIVIINSIIPSLTQMGIGPSRGYVVLSQENLWSDYLKDNIINLEGIKTYIFLKTKLIFDPPVNSTVIEAYNKTISELEWRMMLNAETNNLNYENEVEDELEEDNKIENEDNTEIGDEGEDKDKLEGEDDPSLEEGEDNLETDPSLEDESKLDEQDVLDKEDEEDAGV